MRLRWSVWTDLSAIESHRASPSEFAVRILHRGEGMLLSIAGLPIQELSWWVGSEFGSG